MRRALVGGLLATLVLMTSNATAQEVDEQLWMEVAGRVKLVDDLKLTVAQLMRLDEGISRIGKVMTEASLTYKIFKPLRVHAGYRFIADKSSKGDFRFEHRLFIGARYKYSVGIFDLSYRLEFQEDLYSRKGESRNDNVLRNKVGVDLDVHKIIVPGVSFELLSNIGGTPGTGLRNWRLTIGTEFDLKKQNIGLFYRLRRDFESPVNTVHIIGVGYLYEF